MGGEQEQAEGEARHWWEAKQDPPC